MRRAVDIALILIFFTALSIPMVGFLLQPKAKAIATVAQSGDVFEFLVDTSEYFQENFGYKRTLVNWNSAILSAIGFSETPAVAVNEHGEVIYAEDATFAVLPVIETEDKEPADQAADPVATKDPTTPPTPPTEQSVACVTNTTATGSPDTTIADESSTSTASTSIPAQPSATTPGAPSPAPKPASQAPRLDLAALPKAMVGKDGWLYYTASLDHSPLSETVLATHKTVFERERDWLKEQGIPYILAFAPDKKTIYPEHVPDGFRWDQYASRQDQLIKYLAEHSDLQLVDLRPALLAARATDAIYYKHDTHWNNLGAYTGYTVLAQQLATLFPSVRPIPLSEFDLTWDQRKGGDLASMLGIQASVSEPDPILTLRRKSTVVTDDVEGLSFDPKIIRSIIVTSNPNGEVPSAVVFRDSFTTAMIPFLSEHFGKATYVFTDQFLEEWVTREKPSVVIRVIVERRLLSLHRLYN